jgi:predicted Zn-dependent protease
VNNDGCVELPTVADPTTIGRCTPTADTATAPSATKQQVVRSVVTHELGHGTGVSTHTSDATDIMYMSTINFTRDGHFSDAAAELIQIHNKGAQ